MAVFTSVVSIIASGSSYNAGMYGKYFFENIAKIPADINYASEVVLSGFDNFDKDTLYILLSQSGLSVDTVEAMDRIKKAGVKVLTITNNLSSLMFGNADYPFFIDAGEEKAIAATKTFSATVAMLYLIALKAAQNKHVDITKEIGEIYNIKNNIDSCIKNIDNLDIAAKLLSKQNGFAIFGSGYNYALALETALKIKETSYINTSVYPCGDFVHGHFALLNNTKTFLTFMTKETSEYELNVLKKVLRTYKTKSIVISDVYEDYDCDILVKFDKGQSKIANIINMIVVSQLLALNIAKKLKRNVDKPTGLVKIVESN